MPGRDRTGPYGKGVMTGRGNGSCMYSSDEGAGKDLRIFPQRFSQRLGFRRGFGFRNSYVLKQPLTSMNEVQFLKNQSSLLEEKIKSIKTRIHEINLLMEKSNE